MDVSKLAEEIATAYKKHHEVPPPSSEYPSFSMTDAYAVERAHVERRRARGKITVGRKVGYANQAMWRVLKLETLAWAHMYDHTVLYSTHGIATLAVARMYAPKIEPEIVFKLKRPLDGEVGPAAVLDAVEWMALGFEIIDCVYPDWKFEPADFVAAYGLHAALIVGEPRTIETDMIPAIVDELPRFALRLFKNGEQVDEGSGMNSLKSPALCLGELAASIARQPGAAPLTAGELVSSGTLTTSHPIAPGETWRADVEGIALQSLLLRTTS